MGYAKAEYTYDDLGNQTSERYFDTESLGVTPQSLPYAFAVKNYDDEGRLISEEYFDETGKPAVSKNGYAAHYIIYAASGRIAEENYLGTDLKPAVVDGFSRRVLVSENEENRTYVMRVIDETVEEDAYIGSLQTIDRYGNVIKLSYVDAQDNAAIGPEGCSTVTREYTSRGQVARELYFDGNDVPFSVDGVYGVKKEYSAFAKLIKETWLDA